MDLLHFRHFSNLELVQQSATQTSLDYHSADVEFRTTRVTRADVSSITEIQSKLLREFPIVEIELGGDSLNDRSSAYPKSSVVVQ